MQCLTLQIQEPIDRKLKPTTKSTFLVHVAVYIYIVILDFVHIDSRGRHGRGCMAVGFTTSGKISAYHH